MYLVGRNAYRTRRWTGAEIAAGIEAGPSIGRSKARGDVMKFLCFAYEEEAALNSLSKEEWLALRAETLAYVEELANRGKLVSAEPLQSATRAATVRVRGGQVVITDGPFVETKEQIGGYFLLDVADREEALRIAAGWPSARLGSIEVRPLEDGLSEERRYT
jgi:hypothetical protein